MELGTKANIIITSIRFDPAIKLDIYIYRIYKEDLYIIKDLIKL